MTRRAANLFWLAPLAVAAGAVPVYARVSWSMFINSDDAALVLQGNDIAHGNWLLRGWTIGGDSFFLIEVQLAALSAKMRGLSPAVVHETAAILYVLLLLLVAVLAGRGLPGRLGPVAAGLALALLLAPSGFVIRYVLLAPYHVGTAAALVAVLLVIGSLTGWVRAILIFGILAVAGLSDPLAIYVGASGIAAWLTLQLLFRRRADDLVQLLAVFAAAVVSFAGPAVIAAMGGFKAVPLTVGPGRITELVPHAKVIIHGLLLLFGADVTARPSLIPLGWAYLHLAMVLGLAAAIAASLFVVFRRREEQWLGMALAIIAADLTAATVSGATRDVGALRYVIPAYVLLAVAGARAAAALGPPRPLAAIAAALLALQLWFMAGFNLQQPVAPSARADLEAYLLEQHLRHGFGTYWDANSVTVETGGRVEVAAVVAGGGRVSPYLWATKAAWYQPGGAAGPATFVLEPVGGGGPEEASVMTAFGPPTRRSVVAGYRIDVWDRDLDALLAR